MSKSKKNKVTKASAKKELKNQITLQLTASLANLKELMGEKRFNTRIKKASRLFSSGIKKKNVLDPKVKNKIAAKQKIEKSVSISEAS